MRRCLLAILFALPFASRENGNAAKGAESARPNVLVIVADDLGFHDVGYHGSEIRTPHLDKLAASGVRFEQHYVFTTCSPTRTALLTGRNPSRFDILGPIGGRSEQSVPTETTTMADLFKSRGYVTAQLGKWHLGLRPEVGPRQFGFDTSYGYFHGQVDPFSHLYKNGDRTWHRNDQFLDETGHATDLLAAEALRFLETPRDQPFFLYLAFSVPHTPLAEDAKWIAPYESQIKERSRRLFAASVTHMDDAIGHVLAALERRGQREQTLILFTSDNGGQRDEAASANYGGQYPDCPVLGDNRPLRGWKGELYEGGIRVPALAVWPGKLPVRELNEPASVLDWLPTVAALIGAEPPPDARWEGRDAWNQWRGQTVGMPRRWYWKTGADFAVRDGDWKLIEPRRKGRAAQLFNLAADPLEQHDEAAAQPEFAARLRKLLAEEQQLDPPALPAKNK